MKHQNIPTETRIKEASHRQRVAQHIYSIWTNNGSNESGLALPLLEGRVDGLGSYITLKDYFEEDKESREKKYTAIDRIHANDLTYSDFFHQFMEPNKPVILQGLTKDWKARKKWVQPSHSTSNKINVPNMKVLTQRFGSEIAPVHVQSKGGFTIARPNTTEMTVSNYSEWWQNHQLFQSLTPNEINELQIDLNEELLYLKDWKFHSLHPEYNLYNCPSFFQDDWLNKVMSQKYQFVYLGPKGTCTRLHADVLFSYSWSTNICGIKRWYLIPPEHTYLIKDCFGTHLAPHLHIDCDDDTTTIPHGGQVFYPGLERVRLHAMEIIQYPGETIFVPSGWYHTVENLEDTLSINHNWINGTNIHWSWYKVKHEMQYMIEQSKEQIPSGDVNQTNTSKEEEAVGQLGDDILLLWKLVSMKTNEIVDSKSVINKMSETSDTGLFNSEYESFSKSAFMQIYDLKAILPVLEWIHHIVQIGHDFHLTKKCYCNVHELIFQVQDYLVELEK